jgi:hypothetical protein
LANPPFAPGPAGIPAICPHCWEFNRPGYRLCGRCGADMRTVLQESGGLRRTAPIQSPVPVRNGAVLSPARRLALLGFLMLLLLGQILGALLYARPLPQPVRLAPAAPAGGAGLD